jgi:hypothetical protein
MRASVQEAIWPADVFKAAHDYEVNFPSSEWTPAAHALMSRAQLHMSLIIGKRIALFPGMVRGLNAQSAQGTLARQALLGDAEAARKMAGQAETPDSSRYVGWLQWAAALGNDKAAYELALHYRKLDQPVMAAQYEARALALGFEPPPALDHIRR